MKTKQTTIKLAVQLAAMFISPLVFGASISSPQIYGASADGYDKYPFAADTFSSHPLSMYGGLSGGEMLINLAQGETVTSASMSLAISTDFNYLLSKPYSPRWALSLASTYPNIGTQPGDQLWAWVPPGGKYGEGSGGWTGMFNGSNFDVRTIWYIKVKFEVQTSLGTTVDDNGGSGYLGTYANPPANVPEPSTFALLGAGVLSLLAWRRTNR